MDIFEFIDGISFKEPSPRKLNGLREIIADASQSNSEDVFNNKILLGCWQALQVSLATPAMDDFFMRIHFPLAAEAKPFDYVLASICNFAAQQLAIRRIHDKETYLQIGMEGWPQFIGTLVKNEPLTCHFLLDEGENSSDFAIEIREKFTKYFHPCHQILSLPVENFSLPQENKVGALVLIQLGDAGKYLHAIETLRNRLSKQAELIIQDTKPCLSQIIDKLNLTDLSTCQLIEKDYLGINKLGNLEQKSVLVAKNWVS